MNVAPARAPIDPVRALLVALALLFPVLAYFGTAASIVAIWERSGTFAHGYVIVPISLWLIWQRRAALAGLPLRPFFAGLLALAACGFAWMIGQLGEVQSLRQFAFAAMLPLAALTVLGVPMARAMSFPLLFLLFGVPFGEVFTAPLIDVTANITVDALRLVGIPVFREGNNFTIPSGSWSVVEACSGVRYLISSFTLGCLYAYLTYSSWRRRALFIVLSIIVPIVANGLRAFMIVMIGHLSGMTMAVGFDHLVYGWLFFGLVMFVLFWIGSYWREDHEAAPPAVAAPAAVAGPSAPTARLALAVLAIVLTAGIWPAWLQLQERTRPAGPALVLAPLAAPAAAPFGQPWEPGFAAPTAKWTQYLDQDGHAVAATVFYYRHPPEGVKLISSTNLTASAGGTPWRAFATATRSMASPAGDMPVRETLLSGPGGRLVVWQWYWIDGHATASNVKGKLLQVRQRLLTGGDDGAAIFLATPYDEDPAPARAALAAFAQQRLGQLDAALAQNLRR